MALFNLFHGGTIPGWNREKDDFFFKRLGFSNVDIVRKLASFVWWGLHFCKAKCHTPDNFIVASAALFQSWTQSISCLLLGRTLMNSFGSIIFPSTLLFNNTKISIWRHESMVNNQLNSILDALVWNHLPSLSMTVDFLSWSLQQSHTRRTVEILFRSILLKQSYRVAAISCGW